MEMANIKILLKRSKELGKLSQPNNLDYGELAINYASGSESISFKNAANEIVTLGMKVKQTIGEDEISPISQKALSSAIKEGINNVSTLANVPVDKRLVYATLTQDETLSFDTSKYASCFSAFDKGAQIKVIAFNCTASTHKITLPYLNKNYVCFVKNIVVPVNGYGIITADYDGTNIYVNVKVEERAEGYVGGEAIIALSNAAGVIKYVKDRDLSAFKTKNPEYVPIGIVVIPKSHTQVILKDGDPRKGCNIVMSLKPMNYNTPDEGGTSVQKMYWGYFRGNGITELTDYSVVNCYSDTTQDSSTLTTNGYAYLPSDKFTQMSSYMRSHVCPLIRYRFESTTTSKLIPSPYKIVNNEWLPNEDYYTTRISSKNALSDFEGPSNTKIITDNATAEDWKSVIPIVNSYNDEGIYPAACCCARFKTTGTSSFVDMLNLNTEGDDKEYWRQNKVWYMPACGELGYITPNFIANNAALSNINKLYGSGVAVQLPNTNAHWSSSEKNSSVAWDVGIDHGKVYSDSKAFDTHVRAFCALPA